MKVAFLICNDVLVEVLSYFDRQQLAKLELACRRFHRIVVRCFNKAPFLFFEMECYIKAEPRRFSKIISSPDTKILRKNSVNCRWYLFLDLTSNGYQKTSLVCWRWALTLGHNSPPPPNFSTFVSASSKICVLQGA